MLRLYAPTGNYLSLLILVGLWLSIGVQAQESEDIRPAPAFAGSELAQPPRANWPTNGGDLFNRRYSPLTAINRDNVANLKGVWRTHLNGSGIGPQYSGEAQPIVYEGVIYVVTGADDVFAVSVDTGEILWSYEADLEVSIDTICCGWTSRGLGLGDGKVYLGRLDGKLVALDQKDGSVVWSVQAERWQEGYTITSAPLYYDGMVVTGFAGAEFGVRGKVKAYSARDGKHVWTFNAVPGPGEFGHDTWPADSDAWKYGGGTVWQTPAVDPELGLMYFSTGNPGPDLNGAVRKGDNLFTTSIVAVDASTGEYRWHFQQVHHDLWDLDAANPVILFDVTHNGEERKAIVQVSKTGWAYFLDRVTGEPLIGIDEEPVMQDERQFTSPTQPLPKGEPIGRLTIEIPPEGYDLVNQGHTYTPFWTEPVVTRRVGTNWPPSALDQDNDRLYVCAREYLLHFSVDEDDAPEVGERYDGGTFGNVPFSNGILAAFDTTTNRKVWSQRWPDTCYSGLLVTSSGLLFLGRNDGRVMALDADTGKALWEFKTDAGVNAPGSMFEYKGEQYYTVLSAGNMFVGSERGDSLWLFSLKGDIDDSMVGESAVDAASAGRFFSERGFDNTDGADLFNKSCQFCHASDGSGGENGASLLSPSVLEYERIVHTVSNGRNGMPGFKSTLTRPQIEAVSAYVLELRGDTGGE